MKPKKQQHVIPLCYQRSWLAPDCPEDYEPYVWLVLRNGAEKRRKAPKHVFVEHDKYTIHLTDGSRDLVVEDTLMHTEDAFMDVLQKIKDRQKLNREDVASLCIFVAAMHARTNAMGQHFTKVFGDLHELVAKGERARNASAVASLETKHMAQYAHQHMIQATLNTLPQMLLLMSLAILVTNDSLGFITSDAPCVWFDPDAYKRPPGLRNPSLSNRRIEISLPVTPQHSVLFSYSRLRGYLRSAPQHVDELNRRVRFGCSDHFISWTGETKPHWFQQGVLPKDAWENTAEGKLGLQRAQRNREAAEAWRRAYQEKPS